MSLEFLCPDRALAANGSTPVARSPIDTLLRDAGARFEIREGWSVATRFTDPASEEAACRRTVGIGDRSWLGKLELQAPASTLAELLAAACGGLALELGKAAAADAAWWCPLSAERVLVLCKPGAARALRERLERAVTGRETAGVVDVSTGFAAFAVVGPRARDVLARLTALDLRPARAPVGAFRPGSVARTAAMVLRERPDSFLVLCGSAYAHYAWTVLWDAAQPLEGTLVGAIALERVEAAGELEAADA